MSIRTNLLFAVKINTQEPTKPIPGEMNNEKIVPCYLFTFAFFVPAFAADLVIETIDEGSIHGPGSSIAYDTEGKLHAAFFANDRHSLKHAVLDEDGWTIQTVYETSQNMFADRAISLALDQDNNPHIACVLMSGYDSKRALDISDPANLFYTWYDGTEWKTEILGEPHDFTTFVSLALDSQGAPHIGYSYSGNVEYASKQAEGWNIETVVSGDNISSCSMTFDQNDTPHFSFKTNFSTLHYTFFNGEEWANPVSVDSMANSNHPITTENGIPMISYQDNKYNLKFATLSGDQWITSVVDSSDNVGEYSSINTDGQGGIHISYYERDAYNLKYARYDGSNWSKGYVDEGGNVRMVPSSLAVEPSGEPVISYVSFSPDNDVKCAFPVDENWDIDILHPQGPSTGYYPTIALDSAEDPHMVYSSGNREVYYAYSDGSNWQKMLVASADIIRFGSLEESKILPSRIWSGFGLDGNDVPHVVFPDYESGNLKYGVLSGDKWSFEKTPVESRIFAFEEANYAFKVAEDGTVHIITDYIDPYYETDLEYNRGEETLWHLEKQGDGWTFRIVENAYASNIALTLDQDDTPAACYFNGLDDSLKYGILQNGKWDIQTVFSSDLYLRIYDSTLDFDQKGNPHIAFIKSPEMLAPESTFNNSVEPEVSENELWYATTSGDQWIVKSLDTVGNLSEGSISINMDLEDNPHITYGSGTNEILRYNGSTQLSETEYTELKYTYFDGTDWQTGTLDFGIMPEFGSFSSLTHDSSNRPHVAYFTGTGVNYLTVATKPDPPIPPGPSPDNSGCNIASMPSAAFLLLPLGLLFLRR